MPSHRVAQVNALLQEKVGEFLTKNLELSEALVTVTSVKTTPDLKHADILVSVLPANKRGTALDRLKRVVADLNRELFRELTMHPVPKVRFVIDDAAIAATNIDTLLDSLKDETTTQES